MSSELLSNCAAILGIPSPKLTIVTDSYQARTSYSNRKPTIEIGDQLVSLLSEDELAAVFLHELDHIKNQDALFANQLTALALFTTLMTIPLMFVNLWLGVLSLLFGISLYLLACKAARSAEFRCDKVAAEHTSPQITKAMLQKLIEDESIPWPKSLVASHPTLSNRLLRLTVSSLR